MADLEYQPTCVCAGGLTIYKGRHRTLRVTITNTDITDITGAKLWFSVKREVSDADADAVITKKSANNGGADSEAIIISGTEKIIEYYIVPDDTVDLDFGNYVADAVIEMSSGKRSQLLSNFPFKLQQPVTLGA